MRILLRTLVREALWACRVVVDDDVVMNVELIVHVYNAYLNSTSTSKGVASLESQRCGLRWRSLLLGKEWGVSLDTDKLLGRWRDTTIGRGARLMVLLAYVFPCPMTWYGSARLLVLRSGRLLLLVVESLTDLLLLHEVLLIKELLDCGHILVVGA